MEKEGAALVGHIPPRGGVQRARCDLNGTSKNQKVVYIAMSS